MFRYSDEKIFGKMFFVNPYFQVKNLDENQKVDAVFLEKFKSDVVAENIQNYK
jgi:hypothetical protein